MLSESEKLQLRIYREMGSMSQSQALDYHALLNKELEAEQAVAFIEEVTPEAEAPKKRGRKKK